MTNKRYGKPQITKGENQGNPPWDQWAYHSSSWRRARLTARERLDSESCRTSQAGRWERLSAWPPWRWWCWPSARAESPGQEDDSTAVCEGPSASTRSLLPQQCLQRIYDCLENREKKNITNTVRLDTEGRPAWNHKNVPAWTENVIFFLWEFGRSRSAMCEIRAW